MPIRKRRIKEHDHENHPHRHDYNVAGTRSRARGSGSVSTVARETPIADILAKIRAIERAPGATAYLREVNREQLSRYRHEIERRKLQHRTTRRIK